MGRPLRWPSGDVVWGMEDFRRLEERYQFLRERIAAGPSADNARSKAEASSLERMLEVMRRLLAERQQTPPTSDATRRESITDVMKKHGIPLSSDAREQDGATARRLTLEEDATRPPRRGLVEGCVCRPGHPCAHHERVGGSAIDPDATRPETGEVKIACNCKGEFHACSPPFDDPTTSPDREGERASTVSDEAERLRARDFANRQRAHENLNETTYRLGHIDGWARGHVAGHAAGVERERAYRMRQAAPDEREALINLTLTSDREIADLRAKLAEAEKNAAMFSAAIDTTRARLAAAEQERDDGEMAFGKINLQLIETQVALERLQQLTSAVLVDVGQEDPVGSHKRERAGWRRVSVAVIERLRAALADEGEK